MVFKMQIAIICGGLATRLGNLTKILPKSMIEIKGKPFLEYQIDMLKKQNIKNIILCVGYLSEKIESYFGNGKKFDINIKYSYDEDKQLGPMGAIKKAEKLLEKEFFVLYGDSYIFVDFQKVHDFYKEKGKLACMTVYKNEDKYDNSNLIVENNIVIGYKDSKLEKKVKYIDYGTSILNKKSLDYIPSNTFYSTEEFFKKLILKKEISAYKVNKRFYHIGTPKALEEFRNYIKNQ